MKTEEVRLAVQQLMIVTCAHESPNKYLFKLATLMSTGQHLV